MAYTIPLTESGSTITVPSGVILNPGDSGSTSIPLVGQNVTGYGTAVATALVNMLENFASSSAPVNPVQGQLWYDHTNLTLKVNTALFGASASWQYVLTTTGSLATTLPGATTANGNIIPGTSNTYNLGSTSQYWANLIANDVSTAAINPILTGTLTINANTIQPPSAATLAIKADTISPNATNLVIKATTIQNPSGQTLNITCGSASTVTATTFVGNLNGIATQAEYADLAERYAADAEYSVGTVVKLGGVEEITQTTSYADTDMFGVISENPAYLMNSAAGDDKTHPPVALAGRIYVKVFGPAYKGQRLVSSDKPGYAQVVNNLGEVSPYAIIGRVLQDAPNNYDGLVLVTVGAK